MADNRVPPLVPAGGRRRPGGVEPSGAGSGNWILRAGHRRLYVEPAEPEPAQPTPADQPAVPDEG